MKSAGQILKENATLFVLTEIFRGERTEYMAVSEADAINAINVVLKENDAMVSAFYKIAETIDFNNPEHEGLYDLIFPFLKTIK